MKEYKIIFSDIDGTLLNNENQVPEETIEELRRLDSQGVPFVLVSARMPKGMRPIREELGIHAPMVCYSGGLVLDPDDQEIYSCLLDLDLACEIKSLVAKEFPEVVCGIYGGEHWVVDDIRDPWVIQEQGITHLIPETGDIREIFGKGVPFVLVSARMPKGMRPIREELGIHAPMVCYSGGLVLDPDDQEIYSCLLDLDLACEIKSLVAKEFPEVVCGIYGGEHWVVDDIRDPWVIQEQGITHLIPETGDIREIFGKEGGIHKFLFMGDEEAVIRTENRLKERYPQLSIARSKPVYLEVMNGNVCKSAGVKIVCEKYDIPVEQSLAFGDGQNDLDMLNAAGAGFAMANAPEEVKAAAPFVTPVDNEHQGLLAVLRKYFDEK